jgi:hypothetical protein
MREESESESEAEEKEDADDSDGSSDDDSSSSGDDEKEDVQLGAEPAAEEVDHSGEQFSAQDQGTGTLDKKYERVPPANFATGGDDIFMRSMIMAYADEGKNKDGSPNGVFTMTEGACRAASSEVLGTHKKLNGAELSTYMNTYYPRTWAHFDVNKAGRIGTEGMPSFMRFLASDQQMSLQ